VPKVDVTRPTFNCPISTVSPLPPILTVLLVFTVMFAPIATEFVTPAPNLTL
jgi:hypothetical protein